MLSEQDQHDKQWNTNTSPKHKETQNFELPLEQPPSHSLAKSATGGFSPCSTRSQPSSPPLGWWGGTQEVAGRMKSENSTSRNFPEVDFVIPSGST